MKRYVSRCPIRTFISLFSYKILDDKSRTHTGFDVYIHFHIPLECHFQMACISINILIIVKLLNASYEYKRYAAIDTELHAHKQESNSTQKFQQSNPNGLTANLTIFSSNKHSKKSKQKNRRLFFH